jgi:hypothetical protein
MALLAIGRKGVAILLTEVLKLLQANCIEIVRII